jgi:hypothetical protein
VHGCVLDSCSFNDARECSNGSGLGCVLPALRPSLLISKDFNSFSMRVVVGPVSTQALLFSDSAASVCASSD